MTDARRVLSACGRFALWAGLAAWWAWGTAALAFSPYATSAVRLVLASAFAIALPSASLWLRRRASLRVAAFALLVPGVLAVAAWSVLLRPSNARDWSVDQSRLPHAEIHGNDVLVRDVRNFAWRSTSDFIPAWEDRRYDLARLDRAWFVVEPFSGVPSAAHTFLTFGFDDGATLAVSAEIRKEVGESFSPWRGLFRNYEIMFVLGDERDLVQLRTGPRHDTVYLYPVKASPSAVRAMFVDVLARANALAARPEFYNTAVNNCTTSIADLANRLRPGSVPFSWHLLLPGHSDERALELGLIDFDGSIEQARAQFRIDEKAARAAGRDDFSERIREP